MSTFIITIDQGSSSTKVLAVDQEGRQRYRSSRDLKIERPRPSFVEQDPLHVVGETRAALEEVINSVHDGGDQVVAIGLASQRSSFILWDREEGRAFTPIISWQDLRAKDLCEAFRPQRGMIYQKTGLPLTGHYGGPKFQWLTKNDPRTLKWTDCPRTVFSPWSSFLLWHLTEERFCVADESIAGRTLFFNIHQRCWDQELLDLFQIPEHILPEIRPTCHFFGHYRSGDRSIPIACVLGDHQGALLGLGGIEQGSCGLNYGTSAGFLSNLGHRPHIVNGLLTNIAYSTRSEANYTAEGTVNAAGSLFEWFEKERGISGASKGWEKMAAPSSQGWYMLPGMYGIAAPYWKETAPTEFKGEGPTPPPNVLLRAGMESIAFLVADILDRLRSIPDFKIDRVTAAGGAARPPLLQVQADLLGLPILHSSVSDATALGCAFLTGLQTGFWKGPAEIRNLIRGDETYSPRISPAQRQMLLDGWHNFLKAEAILT